MKVILITIAILFTGYIATAQVDTKTIKTEELAKPNSSYVKERPSNDYLNRIYPKAFSVGHNSVKEVKVEKISLLQQLYLIEDERIRIEKDQSLLLEERGEQITSNNKEYYAKAEDYKKYITSKGILNVPSQEQNYYLYLLKMDKNTDECLRIITLINNSK